MKNCDLLVFGPLFAIAKMPLDGKHKCQRFAGICDAQK
jgi:hypothetical protein